MSDRSVVHSTFTLEREYDAPPDRVFSAWAAPDAKASWFASGLQDYELDFRVGGLERICVPHDGKLLDWETLYREIAPCERIIYTSVLSVDGTTATLSLTTVELAASGEGTRLTLVEQGAYLDGHEQPEWRERGTAAQLDALRGVLAEAAAANTDG